MACLKCVCLFLHRWLFFDIWIRKIPWRWELLPTPVFLLGEFHEEEPGRLQSMGAGLSDYHFHFQLLNPILLFGPHRLQHARLPCLLPSPRVWLNSCLLIWQCYPIISSSVTVSSSWSQSFPASASFPMSWLFTFSGQNIGASASLLPMNIQGWFPLRLTDLISFLSKGFLRVFSSIEVQNHEFFRTQSSLGSNSLMPFPLPGHRPNSGIEPAPTCVSYIAGGFSAAEPPGRSLIYRKVCQIN